MEKKDAQIRVRLTPELRKRLEKISDSTHLDVSSLVRVAVMAIIDDAERKGGRITLPWEPHNSKGQSS
jgi:predicted DNA-binding protein